MRYFISPRVVFGKGALNRLGSELQDYGKKVTLVTDKVMAKPADKVVQVLTAAGYQVNIWDGAEPEPSLEVVLKGSQALLDFQPQIIIGFGGGSAIDTAKALWLVYERPDLASSLTSVNPRTKLNLRRKARFVSIPTTSGTGSDVTWAIVLTDLASHKKISFANNEIVPDVSVLEPELTAGMPKGLTASTGMDVVGHALEGYTSKQQTDFSDGLCLQALKLTFEWLPRACNDGSDLVAREKMQNAATIGGLGFGNSNASLPHAIAHAVGAMFHIPHGRAVGIALPYALEYFANTPPLPGAPNSKERLALAARFVGIREPSDDEAIRQLIGKIRQLASEIGEPLSFKEAKVTEEQMKQNMEQLSKLARTDVSFLFNPCECNDEQLARLLFEMWEGKR